MIEYDFSLTYDEREALNRIVTKFAQNYSDEGEIADGISFKFDFVPGLGRIVSVSYSGSEYIDLE